MTVGLVCLFSIILVSFVTSSMKPIVMESTNWIDVSEFESKIFSEGGLYAQHLVIRGFTETEAVEIAEEAFENIAPDSMVREYYRTVTKGPSKIEFGFICHESQGSYPTYSSIIKTWSKIAGAGNCTWEQNAVPTAQVISKGQKVQLVGSGYTTVAYNPMLSRSAKGDYTFNQLLDLGFEVSHTIGSTTYLHTRIEFNETFKQWYAK